MSEVCYLCFYLSVCNCVFVGVHAFVFVCAELLIGGGGSWELLLLRSSDRVEANIDVFTVVGWSFLNNSLTMQCVV